MSVASVVILFDAAVTQGPDGLPDIGLQLLDWVRVGPLIAVRIAAADFDPTLRLFSGYQSDSALVLAERQMPEGIGPWRWECYDQVFEFAPGAGWPPEDEDGDPEI